VTDRIIDKRVKSFDRNSNGLIIIDEDGRAYGAERIIVSTGPWIRELVQGFDSADVTTSRQAVGWYEPGDRAKVRHGLFPIFILDCPEGLIYGFPYAENEGLKAANHRHGPWQAAADLVQNATADDLTEVTAALEKYLRAVDPGTPTRQDFCLYTNTRDDQFIVDWLPVSPGAGPDVIVVSPCSGHGFKFASAIGETVAEMAEYGTCCPDGAFRISRFASFQKLA
jgi:sarcosine oxidase